MRLTEAIAEIRFDPNRTEPVEVQMSPRALLVLSSCIESDLSAVGLYLRPWDGFEYAGVKFSPINA